MSSSTVAINFFPRFYTEWEDLNLDLLKNTYNQEKEEDNFPLDVPLFRMQAIPTLLFHEKVGIIPVFRDKRPRTRKIIDDWIDNTSRLSYDSILRDLNTIKEFLLSCDDLFQNEDDNLHVIPAMIFFLRERILWCNSNVKKLKNVLGI